MITYREIKEVMDKITVLDGHISHLTQVMSTVSQLSDQISTVYDGLAADRQYFNSEIRSVEVLQDILRKHVYQPDGPSDRNHGEDSANNRELHNMPASEPGRQHTPR